MLYSKALMIPGTMRSSDHSMTFIASHAMIMAILRTFLKGTNSSAKLALPLLLTWKNLIRPIARGTMTKKVRRSFTML